MAKKKRIFISFAKEDAVFRTFLVGQARNRKSPLQLVDMSVKEPWSSSWKTRCRRKIKGCDGVVALLSKKTRNAKGARWEMKCAREEQIPIIGVHIDKNNKGAIPTELRGKKVINWTWNGIADFIRRLRS